MFRFDTAYSLSPELTMSVSDHYPVEFQLQSTATGETSATGGIPATGGTSATSGTSVAVLSVSVLALCVCLFIATVPNDEMSILL